jgi:uncharacterized SAM-binding protein YcdF (DUF218 family)
MIYLFFKRLLQPFLLLFLTTTIANLNLWRRRVESRRRLAWISAPLIGLYLFCTPAVSYLALGTLEWRYPPANAAPDGVQAIVVLSGGIYAPNDIQLRAVLGESTIYRCLHAHAVYQASPRPILLSGGKVYADREGPTLAEAMRDFMLQLGVPQDDLILENESRSTYENAVHSAEVLRRREISNVLLVTDATHLDRSIACFAAQDINAIPSGCRYRAAQVRWSLFSFLPDPSAAQSNQDVFHEWAGILWYWTRGRI